MSRLNPLLGASRLFPSPPPSAFARPSPSLNFSTPFARAPHSSPLHSTFSHSFPSRPYSTPHRSRQAQNYARARPFLLLLGIMPVFTFALGSWQLKRLEWKLDLIQQLQDKLHQEPIGLPPRIDPEAIPEFAYRKVRITGHFDHAHEIHLGPKTRDGELGYHVIVPFVRGDGQDTILVNRGFVKRAKRDQNTRPESLETGEVEIIGMLRAQDRANAFTPKNDTQKGEWVWSDIKQMAEHAGAEPVLVDEIYTGHAGEIGKRLYDGVPVGRAATIELRNQHLTYAVTWYALSAATTVMFFLLWRQRTKAAQSMARFRASVEQ